MSLKVLDQLTGPLHDVLPNTDMMVKSLKYGTVCSVDFSVGSPFGTTHFNRPRAVLTNLLTPLGSVAFELIHDVGTFDGINSQFINEYGTIDEGTLYEAMKRSGVYRPGIIKALSANLASDIVENHTGVLFNLLRMKLMAEANWEKLTVDPSDIVYSDGYVAQDYRMFLREDFEKKTDVEFLPSINVTRFSEGMRLDRGDYAPCFYGMTSREVSIVGMALAGWRCSFPVRAFSGSPPLCNRLVITPGAHFSSLLEAADHTAREVDVALRKFVAANRLEAQFDLAYTLLASLIYVPVPRNIEGNAWVSAKYRFRIPVAGSIRGLLDEFTQASPYRPRPSATVTWDNYRAQPTRLFIHAIALTEALYTGMFELMTNAKYDLLDTISGLGIMGAGNMKPFRFLMECASYRFGKSFEVKWRTNSGPDHLSRLITITSGEYMGVPVDVQSSNGVYNIVKQTVGRVESAYVRPDTAKPAVFPVLSLGINDDRYYMNALKHKVTLKDSSKYGAYFLTSDSEANKALYCLRLAGWDALCKDTVTGATYNNWSATHGGRVAAEVRDRTGISQFYIPKRSMMRSKQSWIDIGLMPGDLTLTSETHIMGYVLVCNGKLVNLDCTTYSPVVTAPRIYSEGAATEVVMTTAADLHEYDYSDFALAIGATAEQPESLSDPVATAKLQHTEPLVQQEQDQAQYDDNEEI